MYCNIIIITLNTTLIFHSRRQSDSCCVYTLLLLLPVSEAQVWPWVYVPQGDFWLQAIGPCQRARSDMANNLQMLACIRAWQHVMSPPTLPHSSITSHLLSNNSRRREGRADTTTMRLWCPSTQIKNNTSQKKFTLIMVRFVTFLCDYMWSIGYVCTKITNHLYGMSPSTDKQTPAHSSSADYPYTSVNKVKVIRKKILKNLWHIMPWKHLSL